MADKVFFGGGRGGGKSMAGKYTKESVDYSKGTPEKHCGICEHYRHGSCRLVKGEIDPDYWCEKFMLGLPATIRAALNAKSQ